MGLVLLFLFLAVPAAEIAIFIKVGGLIGLWPTLGLIFGTALAGAAVLRHQGLATLRRARGHLGRHEVPVGEIFDGACLVVAAVLLLTPGLLTDSLGALLLVPALRRLLRRALGRALAARAGWVDLGGAGPPRGDVIDGEFTDVTPGPPRGRGSTLDRPHER